MEQWRRRGVVVELSQQVASHGGQDITIFPLNAALYQSRKFRHFIMQSTGHFSGSGQARKISQTSTTQRYGMLPGADSHHPSRQHHDLSTPSQFRCDQAIPIHNTVSNTVSHCFDGTVSHLQGSFSQDESRMQRLVLTFPILASSTAL